MPVWTFNLTGSDVALGHAIFLAARVDPQVVNVLIQDSAEQSGLLHMTIDTGPYPAPLARNVQDFIRTHSDEYPIMEDDALNELRRRAGSPIPEGVNYSAPPSPSFRAQAQQIVENYLRRSAEALETDRARLASRMIFPIASRRFDPRALFPIQQMPPGAVPIYDVPPLSEEVASEEVGTLVIPAWCVPGTWVEEKRHRTAARITAVDTTMFTVNLSIWKTDPTMFYMMNVSQLLEEWEPSSEPREGRPWYERIDEDE